MPRLTSCSQLQKRITELRSNGSNVPLEGLHASGVVLGTLQCYFKLPSFVFLRKGLQDCLAIGTLAVHLSAAESCQSANGTGSKDETFPDSVMGFS